MLSEQGSLFPEVNDESTPGAIFKAAQATIVALEETGTLDKSHSLKVQLILDGAKALDREFKRVKLTVATMQLYSKVIDVADGLPTVQQAVNDQFAKIVESLKDA